MHILKIQYNYYSNSIIIGFFFAVTVKRIIEKKSPCIKYITSDLIRIPGGMNATR